MPPGFEHVDVRGGSDDAIAQLPLQAGHQASAMRSAITPTVTPSVETNEMSEMNACFRLRQQIAQGDESSNGSRPSR